MYCVISWKLPSGFSELGRSLQQLQIVILLHSRTRRVKTAGFKKIEKTNYTVNSLVTLGYFFTFL